MTLRVEKKGAVGWIVFDQPKKRNAINDAMWRGIPEAMQRFDADPEVRCVAFRGEGTEAFSAGADISEFEKNRANQDAVGQYDDLLDRVLHSIQGSMKPSVAMIYGFCMGGAMGIAMACDLRFAAEGARFGIPAARLNIVYPPDAIGQLVDLIGPAYAKDILFSARTLDDREALAIGLIQRLVPADTLERVTYEYLTTVAANAPQSVRGSKQAIQFYRAGYTEERRRQLRELAREAFESEDYKEGTRAFLEKRAPRFQGR